MISASIPLGRTHERDVNRLLSLADVVILAVSLPAIGDYLDHELSRWDHWHVAYSRLVRLQIHLDLLVLAVLVLLDVSDVDTGAVNGLLIFAAGDDNCQPRVFRVRVPLGFCGRVLILAVSNHRNEKN
jgi:hypothetical protein